MQVSQFIIIIKACSKTGNKASAFAVATIVALNALSNSARADETPPATDGDQSDLSKKLREALPRRWPKTPVASRAPSRL